jgi:hypothetical protein
LETILPVIERTSAPGTSMLVIEEQGTPMDETEDRKARE